MKELKQQLVSALLVVITVAAVVAAATNFQQQSRFHLPDDGVTWVDAGRVGASATDVTNPSVFAAYIQPGSAADRAGIRKGDYLISIADVPVKQAIDATAILARLGAWRKTEYKIRHEGVEVPVNVIIGEAQRDSTIYYQYAVGAVYLAIGLFVYFRRGSAPRAMHFFLLCLASFILSTFHYSGKLNNFDKIVYLGNVVAGFLAPTLFLHFCLVFPEPQKWIRKQGGMAGECSSWRVSLIYLPGAALLIAHLGFVFGWLATAASLIETRWLLDRVWLGFLSAMYIAGGVVLSVQMSRADDAIVRRQLTWLRNGAFIGILPFTLLYVVPYMIGAAPTHAMNLAVLSLPFIPVTWAYAILRYRLMDVDIIFQEGYVYTLATLCILAVFYGLIFSVGKTGEISGTALVALILIAAFVFQPIRNWIQEQLDRYYFYKDRYDYRRTLIEFARELGSPTDLDEMLESVADRLIRTLGIRHVAFFVWNEQAAEFRLQLASNREGKQTGTGSHGLDLSFLSPNPAKPYLFFERTRNMLDVVSHDLPATVRRTIGELELTYYLPCSARGRTIAYLGVSRTDSGDFLSSEDVELLVTLSGYVGIAIDNAMLYRSLQRKVEEYERLKEFSENIVESIHVGILAADLDNRVESWNAQLEKMTGILRIDAVGRTLGELLPEELCRILVDDNDEVREPRGAASDGLLDDHGIRNIYKFVMHSVTGEPKDITLNIAIAPLVSKDGAHIGKLIIFEDVTDRAELERRLLQSDKLSSIGLLAAGVAHEVNTPLAVISTYAQMLAKQIAGDAQKASLLERIAKQTFRASEIVNSLLNFSRTSPTEFVSVDLNKIISETLTLIEHQLQKARVEVRLDLAHSRPRLRGNPGKLQQVFLNMFLNARDAMESGGTLTVQTEEHAGTVRVFIADSGSGIAPENLERIFDPFFTTKTARKGTGLGLSVSYGIVKEHGGEIEVQSEMGVGTRFELSFPVFTRASAKTTASEQGRSWREAALPSAPRTEAPPHIPDIAPAMKTASSVSIRETSPFGAPVSSGASTGNSTAISSGVNGGAAQSDQSIH